jgi:alpha-L-fucosidase
MISIDIPTPTVLTRFLSDNPGHEGESLREANIRWFRQAGFGLFMHYGLYSILAGEWPGLALPQKGSEWIRLSGPVPFHEYAKLQRQFSAEAFNADAICELALAAGMRYINLTTQHHDGFCLWNTTTTDFSSVHAPAGRDLVAELGAACQRHELGFFAYYSHGRDWWHPHAPASEQANGQGFDSSRPLCPEDAGHFKSGDDLDIDRYLDLVSAQVAELCRIPGVTGIWLDGIGGFKNMEDGVRRSRAQELYDEVHAIAPHLLIGYKQGLTYTEDFYAPERQIREGSVPADGRPYEICTTLQPQSWGCKRRDDGKHRDADWVMGQLAEAAAIPANLLLNTGPEADGSIPPEDIATLREVGRRLAEQAGS